MRMPSLLWLSIPMCLGFAACAAQVKTGEPAAPSSSGNGLTTTLGSVAGCKLQNNCPYGSYCNHESGFCETRKCSEGCPGNAVCNEGLDRCQDAPPASPPNDQLPQDSKIDNLPGTH